MRQGKDLYLPPRNLPNERTNARKKVQLIFFYFLQSARCRSDCKNLT